MRTSNDPRSPASTRAMTASSVGAGAAFSAICIIGSTSTLLLRWSREVPKSSREPSTGPSLHRGGGSHVMTQDKFSPRLDAARIALRIGLGLAAFLAGLDKFVGLLADWPGYLAPVIASALPVSPRTF